MPEPHAQPSTRLIIRLQALLEVLQDGPLSLSELTSRLGSAYPPGDSARRMLDRDLAQLAALGITVERSSGPPVYTLRGGLPRFTVAELRVLALVRDTFDTRHPQAAQVAALLARLTGALNKHERREYERRGVRRAPVRPAVDYAPFAATIEQLEEAITVRQPVGFRYRSTAGREREHPHVEPYEIEFYDRHFYLVGYTSLSRQILDFRVDRISALTPLDQRLPPGSERERPLVTFRYRLAAAIAASGLSQRFEAQRIVERLPNGDLVVEAQGRSDFFIIQTLLRYRANAELLSPDWLRTRMAEEAHRLIELYRDEPAGGGAGVLE